MQLQEWRAYADLEPWDETRADLRTAHIVCVLLNQNRRKGQKAITLEECLLPFGAAGKAKASADEAREAVRKTLEFMTMLHAKPEKKKRKR